MKKNNAITLRGRRMQMGRVWPYLFVLPYLLCYFLFNLFPMLYSFYISFFDWNGVSPKTFVGLQNYADLLTKDPLFWKSLTNTLAMVAISIPVQVGLGLLAAALLFPMKHKRAMESIMFLPYIIAPIAIGAIFANMFDWQFGYINEVLSHLQVISEKVYWLQDERWAFVIVVIMQIWRHMGYCMIIYLAGMTSISSEIYEAAKIDGANSVQLFWHITVPQLRPMTVFLVLTSIINGLQLYEMPAQLYAGSSAASGGPQFSVLTVIWKFINDAFGPKMRLGYGAALCYILFVIIVVFSMVFKKLTAKED